MASIDNVQDLTPRVQYTAATAQVAFDYPFPIFDDGDLVVDVDNAIQTLTTDYTVSGEGDDTGGTVTFVTAPGNGAIVTIYRDIPVARDTDFQQNGPFASTSFNDELDKIMLILQQIEDRVGRSIRFPLTASITNAQAEMSPLSGYLGKFLRVTSAGILEAAEVTSNVVTLSAEVIGALMNPQTTIESSQGLTPTAYRYEIGDVRRWGVNPGSDVTSVLESAITTYFSGFSFTDLDQSSQTITFPPGEYTISSEVDFDVAPNTTIIAYGATFLCTHNGIAFNMNSQWDGTTHAGADTKTKRRVHWKGGTFNNTNGTKTASEGIRAQAMRMFTISDAYFENFYAGVRIAAKDTYRLKDCYFYNNSRHVYLPEAATVAADTLIDFQMRGCHFSCVGDVAALYCEAKFQGLLIDSTSFNGACTSGQVYIADSALLLSEGLRLNGAHFEQIDSVGAVVFSESNGNGFYGISIGGGTTFNSGTAGWKGVRLDFCRGVNFGDVIFRDGSGGATEEAINVDSDSRDIVVSETVQFLSVAAGNEIILSAASDRANITLEPSFIRSATPDILTGYGGDAQSDQSATQLDMSAIWADWSNFLLPPKGYEVAVTARDSASAAAAVDACEVRVFKPSANSNSGVMVWLNGVPNSGRRSNNGFVGADDNGDIDLDVDATGTDTLDLWIGITGVHQ